MRVGVFDGGPVWVGEDGGLEAARQFGPDFGLESRDIQRTVQNDEAVWLIVRQVQKALADCLVKRERLLLHAIELAVATLADSGEAGLGWQVDEEGEIRLCCGHSKVVDGFHLLGVDRAGDALVDGGGVHKAVAEHDLAGGYGRSDDFAHVLQSTNCVAK